MNLQLVSPSSEVRTENEICFDNFWLLYPRHEARKDASKAWSQTPPQDHLTAIEAIVNWRRIFLLRETQHIPLAATWLRGERYFDELPKAVTATASAHLPFGKSEAPAPRGEIPQHVKDAIARLKQK